MAKAPQRDKKSTITRGELRALVAGRSDAEISAAVKKLFENGRRRVQLDLDQLARMRMAGCTISEIAAEFGVCEKTIDNRLREDILFRDVYQRGDERGKAAIRMTQFRKAVLDKDLGALIWLGKNRLGQKDEVTNVITGPNGGPVNIQRSGPDYSQFSDDEIQTTRRLALKALGQLPEGSKPVPIPEPVGMRTIDAVPVGDPSTDGAGNGSKASA